MALVVESRVCTHTHTLNTHTHDTTHSDSHTQRPACERGWGEQEFVRSRCQGHLKAPSYVCNFGIWIPSSRHLVSSYYRGGKCKAYFAGKKKVHPCVMLQSCVSGEGRVFSFPLIPCDSLPRSGSLAEFLVKNHNLRNTRSTPPPPSHTAAPRQSISDGLPTSHQPMAICKAVQPGGDGAYRGREKAVFQCAW